MTALPPTKGHLNLIRFASELDVSRVNVVVCTQPIEPMSQQRVDALIAATKSMHTVRVVNIHQTLEQDPSAPGFWEMWDSILLGGMGAKPGDVYVSSEPYGATLAQRLGGTFIPYDPNRELYYTKATNIREHMTEYFHDILPEFQPNLMSRITIFGAESTGKTTLSKQLSYELNAHWLFEYARPYLELVGPEISVVGSMNAIWTGQKALQGHARNLRDRALIIQDTDLYSTVGYWEQPHWQDALGNVPYELRWDALEHLSDLYIITKSDIPFEEDPLRYGGDRRESSDAYWIGVAERYNLPYVVLDVEPHERLDAAKRAIMDIVNAKAESIMYDRRGL